MRYIKCASIASLIILAACSGNDVKERLGLDRGTPDEFRVVSRPPLSVPPEFDLRPPVDTAGGLSTNQLAASTQAQDLLTGAKPVAATGTAPSSVVPATAENTAESSFLKQAGAGQADPKVRQEIVEDQLALQEQRQDDSGWWNLWSAGNAPKKDTMVNATKEAQRIQTDEDTGQPVTTGDTPVVKQRNTGLLGQIFGY